VVADGLAEAVPLDDLRLTGEGPGELHSIALPPRVARPTEA
jgi:hypothetical protein